MRFTIPISKAEEQADGSVIVEGIATSEAVDSQGEIVDYDAAKTSFGLWPGNIREMHQPIAAGRSLGVTADDETRSIHLRAFVSAGATETKAKVLDGTLKSFSIGGRAARRVKEGDNTRLFLSRVTEVSLVDVGSNPECSVSIAKMDGTPDVNQRFAEWASESGITVPAPDVAKVGFQAYADMDTWGAPQSTFDALRALYALAVVETLAAAEAKEEQVPEETGQAAQLAAAVANLKAFIAAEITETHGAPAPVLMAEPAGDVVKAEDPAPADEDPPPDPPAEKAETLNPAPAAEAGVSVSGSDVEKADTTGADVAKALLDLAAKVDTLKADLDASREEGVALQARIEKMSTRVVDPGRPVYKDASGRLTATNPDAAGASNHGISADDVRKLWSEYPDPASFQRALAGKLAEAETRAALFGGSR
ncbi:MAG: hypothetical protein PHU75_03830 [Candidatus Nanopelagicales bacterium]|nr:hypothetical protein [Candidatus Nanopelagicales bacterium]